MSLKSHKGALTFSQSIKPAVYTTTQTGDYVDIQGSNAVDVVFDVGTITDGTFTPSITECDTSGGSYTAVAADNIEGTLTAFTSANDDQVITYSLKGKVQRYIKAVLTVSGSPGTGGAMGAFVIESEKNKV